MTCARRIVRAVIEKEGKRWEGSNACSFPQTECPRGDALTGVGYELCKTVCGQEHHAEISALKAAGTNARGGVLTLHGHSYCCDACIAAIRAAGISKVIIEKDPV